jgi:hypothetical protein
MESTRVPEPGEWDPAISAWIMAVTENWIVSVTPMMFNDRVCVTAHDEYPRTYTAGWCYDKGGAAALAAGVWDPETQPEPVGFKKRAGDQT